MNCWTKSRRTICVMLAVSVTAVCSLPSLAASEYMYKLQGTDTKDNRSKNQDESMGIANSLVEETDIAENFEPVCAKQKTIEAGSMWMICVDQEIREATALQHVTVPAGSRIKFFLNGVPESAAYQAGYMDGTKKRTYVTVTNGTLDHMFEVEHAGTYELFVEPVKKQAFHITGNILAVPAPIHIEEAEKPESYEKSVTKVYLACGADIPVSIAYSEYNEELDQEYAGTLYMTSGDMKPGFQFYAVYEGTLDRTDLQASGRTSSELSAL